MKIIDEWLLELPQEYRDKAIAERKNAGGDFCEINCTCSIGAALAYAFSWNDSEEGAQVWTTRANSLVSRLESTETFSLHTRVRKTKGSAWQGRVCGYYSTALTPNGVCVESEFHPGSVQIYPASALEVVP